MEGRPNKPTTLKVLEGNPGKRPLSENEPKPEISLIPCPDYLKSDVIAFEEWNRIVPELYKLGLLTRIDRVSLELYASQYSIYRASFEIINDPSSTSVDKRRAGQAARESAKIIKILAGEFGMTPSSRGRISLPKEKDDSGMRELIFGKR